MKESTIKLLQECHSGCHMAIGSLEQMIGLVQDKSLRRLIVDNMNQHQKIRMETEQLLHEEGKSGKLPGNIVSAMSWVTTEMKMAMDGSSHQAASVLTDGCNMGIKSISESMNQCKKASAASRKLAGRLIETEENFMHHLRPFM